jgi:hypothetical protein
MPLKAFEPAIPAMGTPQTHALDRPATGIDLHEHYVFIFTDSDDTVKGNSDTWLLHEAVTEYLEESNWD